MMPPRAPSENQLRPAEAASWGHRLVPVAVVKIRSWRPYRNPAGTMLGFVSAQLPWGMIINDMKLMIGPKGRRWLAMPSQKQLDRDG